jgi:mRNA interferase MazF
MKRGDLVTVALAGAYGKPRPALIVQSTLFENLDSVTFLPFTTDILSARIFRVLIMPNTENGLQRPSQVMADKCSTLPRQNVGAVFGRLGTDDLNRVDLALATFLGFARQH